MKICLVGNQNSGKTTLFNALTGMSQKIGNWPGVTIEKKTGIIKGTNYEVVDLPGIYSLNPYTEEEKVSINYIIKEKPDIIINIIDATNLERSLYLTTQLLELNAKIIVALNMTDLLSKKGIKIDIVTLETELNTKICEISAQKQIGIEALIKSINKVVMEKKSKHFQTIYNANKCYNCLKNCSTKNNDQNYEEIATKRYKYISNLVEKCLYKKRKWITNTEILDKIFLNKILSMPIFVIIIFSIYALSVGIVGKYTSDIATSLIEDLTGVIEKILKALNTTQWLQSLILDGAIKGLSTVLSFVPQLITLFTCISILETTGYMSRIAFLLDGFLKKIGLSGKSIIPLILGTGCSVPAILSTKIIENPKQRKITSILVPFVPCSAKLPIIALFSGYFFKENTVIISVSLYFFSVFIIILSSILIKKLIIKNDGIFFISELPDYKIPDIKYILRDVWEKTSSFIKRAGTTILCASIILWFLISFSVKFEYGIDIKNSILAIIGKKISWIFYPVIGMNSWEATVSAIQGLIAKEQVISSISIISGFNIFTKASAYSYVVFNIFSAPCISAIMAMKKELGNLKNILVVIAYQTILAWLLSATIYKFFLLIF